MPDAAWSDLGNAVLLPALVNAHIHLGITGLAGRHPQGQGLVPWLDSMVPAARAMTPEQVTHSVTEGIDRCVALGTGLVGEIAGRPEVVPALLQDGRLLARVFFEYLGVKPEAAEQIFAGAARAAESLAAKGLWRIQAGLSPHAPYSVLPQYWKKGVELTKQLKVPWSSHVAESPEEVSFLRSGEGAFRDYLTRIGAWDDGFPVPGASVVSYLESMDVLDESALLVHGVCLDESEIERLAMNDVALCLCPGSNAYLGLPQAPVTALHEAGVFLCLGTDSLASNQDLSVWAEMRRVHDLAPGIAAVDILQMATANGAMALGFGGKAGVLAPDVPARLVAVELPQDFDGEPEEYLVSEPVEDRLRLVGWES